MDRDSRIYVAGADSLIGAAIQSELDQRGYTNVIRPPQDATL